MDELSEKQIRLLQYLEDVPSLEIQELRDDIDDVRRLIDLGFLKLLIVQRPWGVEFEIEASKTTGQNDPISI